MANELRNNRRYNRELRHRLNSWFEDNLLDFPKDVFDSSPITNFMQSDIVETKTQYIIKIDMPGMNKDKINLSYRDGNLSVSGSRESFSDLSDQDGNILHNERSIGRVSRQYYLPDIDKENIHAKYEGGVLTVTLDKTDTTPTDEHNIPIE